jgi:hypothetical protein
MEIQFEGDQVVVVVARGVLVLSHEAFIAALKQGKLWRRRQVMLPRQKEPSRCRGR